MANFPTERKTKSWVQTPRVVTEWSVPDCVELTAEHELLKRRYAVIVNRLFTIGYQVTGAEYRELKNSVEEARIQAEIAGERLKNHITHGSLPARGERAHPLRP
jgi:hypothetical protein